MRAQSPHRSGLTVARRFCLGFLFAVVAAGPGWAQQTQGHTYEIPAGGVMEQVNQIAQKNGLQVVYGDGTDVLREKNSASLSGTFTWSQALDRVLAGTNLAYTVVNNDTIVIKTAARAEVLPQTGTAQPTKSDAEDVESESAKEEEMAELKAMTVTGTHIRGASTPSPIVEITSVDIERQGFTNLGEAIRSMPQNFSGGENPGVVRVSQSFGRAENGNTTGGSALNLRGLGPGATLTLLNGRRMSYGGDSQAVDIALIPVHAVERVEVMVDGASATYGSDAVAGVGNVILKRNFNGVSISTDQGVATQGGLRNQKYSLTAGKAWSSGSALFAFTKESNGAIYADQRDYTEYMNDPYTIFPKVKEHGALLSMRQSFGSNVELEVDALSSRRNQWMKSAYTNDYMTYQPHNKNELLAPALNIWLKNDWKLSISSSWGKNDNTEVLTNTDFDTGETEHFGTYKLNNSIRTYQLDVEGPLFELGGREARLAAGIGYRENEFDDINVLYDDNSFGGKEKSKSIYTELNLPFIGPDSGIRGVRDLSLTVAVRSEDYESFGRVTTPKLGLIYSPSSDFTIKGTWGKSFRAPTLTQRFGGQYAYIGWAVDDGYQGDDGEGLVDMYINGGNPDLEPERARVWSATATYHPESISGLRLDLTGYDIDYTNRIVEPIQNSMFALSNPAYGDFILLDPTSEQYEAAVSQLKLLENWDEIPYSPDGLHAIINDYLINAERQRIRGIDLSAYMKFDVGLGQLALNGTISRLNSSQRTIPGQASQPLSGTIYNPPKLSARIGATWIVDEFSMAAYMNHTGSVLENYWEEDGGATLTSFNILDLTFRYAPQGGLLSGTEFSLSVKNALDRKPTLFDVPGYYVLPYDATNASPIGRYLSLGLSKHW